MVAFGGRGKFRAFGVPRNAGRPSRSSTQETPEASVASTANSTIAVSPSSIADDGISSATVTLTIKDQNSALMSGFAGNRLTVTCTGSGNTITQPSGSTDENGQITATIVSTSAASKTLGFSIDGATATDTEALTVTTDATLVFANDFPATGTSSANVRGSTGATPFPSRIGSSPSSLSVVDAVAEGLTGWPSTNALRVDLVYIGGGVQNMETDEVSIAPSLTPDLTTVMSSWTAPADGESVYFRIYKYPVYPDVSDPGALNNNNHPLEEQSGGGTNWSWTFGTNASGFNPRFQVWVGGSNTRFILGGGTPLYLSRNTTYRLEWSLDRISSSSRAHRIRIYNSADTLLYTEADFYNEFTPFQSLDGFTANYSDINDVGYWQVGTNGPHVTGASVGASPAWYWGAPAISRTSWCGAYVNGETP